MGQIGMKKKIVMKRIPFFIMKFATAPHFPQRICCGVYPDPHVKKRTPMIIICSPFQRLPEAVRFLLCVFDCSTFCSI